MDNKIEWQLKLVDQITRAAGNIDTTLAHLTRGFAAATNAVDHFSRAQRAIQAPARAAQGAMNVMGQGLKVVAVGAAGVAAIGGVAAFGMKGIIEAASEKQTQLISFATLLGSSSKALNLYANAVAFADRTPFETTEIVDVTKKMLGFGFTTKQIPTLLTAAGDATSALGKKIGGLETIVDVFGKMKAAGRASMENINQLSDMGVPAMDVLGKGFAMTGDQMAKAISKGSVRGMDAIGLLTKYFQSEWGGGMDKQSKTIDGLFSTLKSRSKSLFSSLLTIDGAGTVTGPLAPFQKFMENLVSLSDWSKSPGSRIQAQFQASVGGLFKAIFGTAANLTSSASAEKMVSGLLDKFDVMVKWFSTNGPKVVAVISSVFTGISSFIQKDGPTILKIISSVFDGIRQAVLTLAPVIVQLAPYIPQIIGFFLAFQGAMALVSVVLGLVAAAQAITLVLAAISAAGGVMAYAGIVFAAAGGPIILAALGIAAVAFVVVKYWSSIGPFFSRLWSGIVSWTSGAFATLKFLFFNFTPLGLVIANFNPILNFFSSLPARFMQAGTNMMNGLRDGILGGFAAVGNAVKGAADMVTGVFSGPKGIDAHSPSRVFHRLGSFIPAGIETGIYSGQARVAKAVQALAFGASITAGATVAMTGGAMASPSASSMAVPTSSGASSARFGAARAVTVNQTFNLTGSGVASKDMGALMTSVKEQVINALEELSFEVGGSA